MTTNEPGPIDPVSPTPGTEGSSGDTKERAQQAAGTAADEAKNVAGTAQSEAGKVAQDAKSEVRGLLDQATGQVDDQARTQRDRLVGVLGSVSDDMHGMADNGQSGLASDLVRDAATRVRTLSDRLDGREPSQLLDDVKGFARRSPGTFLLGALGAGIVVGRLTRGARDAQSTSSPAARPHRAEPTPATSLPPQPYADPNDLPGVSTVTAADGSTLPGGHSR